MISADADVDSNSPDVLYLLTIVDTGALTFRFDDRNGHSGNTTVPDLIRVNRWHHIAMQKNANDSKVRVFCDGNLVLTDDVAYPISNFDM